MSAPAHEVSQIFLELGATVLGLAVPGRIASRFGFSAIPLYLLAGLAFGNGFSELGWSNNPETPAVLSVLVLEDLAMAIYIPLNAVLLAGGSTHKIAVAGLVAIATVAVILLIALRWGKQISGFFAHGIGRNHPAHNFRRAKENA